MTETAVATTPQPTPAPLGATGLAPIGAEAGASAIEALIIQGDLAKITAAQRVAYYRGVCESLGLNPFTRPFDYINLDGKLTLYPRKDATDQLRSSRGIAILELSHLPEDANGITTVRAHGRDIHGREDWATGSVFTKGLAGQNLANAHMKAETKAKRRLTLSLVGLGWLDESEIEAARAVRVVVNMETGEIDEADAARLSAIPSAAERLAARRAHLEASAAHSTGTVAEAVPSAAAEGGAPTDPVTEADAETVWRDLPETPAADPLAGEVLPETRVPWTKERVRAEAERAGVGRSAASEALMAVADGRATNTFTADDWRAVAADLKLPGAE